MRYKLLVIDDELNDRKSAYEKTFSAQFDLSFCEHHDLETLNKGLNDPEIDCIMLDMVLSGKVGVPNKDVFDTLLEVIGRKKPIILTSRYFDKVASWVNLNRTNLNDVIYFFGWNEIYNSSLEEINDSILSSLFLRVKKSLNDYFNHTNSIKNDNENITILHLADMQFGDPNFSGDSDTLSELIIANHLVNVAKKKIDFIAITGDVTYSGTPSEFSKASKWIESLCKSIFPEEFRNLSERILLVPGNHDVNLSLNAADYYEYDFRKRKENSNDNELFLKRRNPEISDHNQFRLIPFCEFAYGITKENVWIDRPHELCFANDKFIRWGIRFIHLNTVMELDYLNPSKFSIKEDVLNEFGRRIPKRREDIFTIYLAHNSPHDLGYVMSSDQNRSVGSLFGLINAIGGNLFLHGHRHKVERLYDIPYEGNITSKLKYSQTGTISLTSKVRGGSDSRRGFSTIEIERENGKIIGFTQQVFELEEQSIAEVTRKKTIVKFNV